MRIDQIVNDSLSSPVDYNLIAGKKNVPQLKTYQFNIDNVEYEVRFLNSDNNWEFDFGAKLPDQKVKTTDFTKTGLGNQQRVLSTVIQVLRDFVKKYQPNVIMFSADKSEGNRARVYQALIKKFAPEMNQLGYTANLDKNSGSFADFYITKNK